MINNPNYQYQYNQPKPLPQQIQPQPIQQAVSSDRIWVQGKNAGKSYLVAKNTEQVLWDYENPCIYIKTVDAFGHPSMTILDYTIRQQVEEDSKNSSVNTEIETLKNEFEDLKKELREFMNQDRSKNNYKPNYRKENKE